MVRRALTDDELNSISVDQVYRGRWSSRVVRVVVVPDTHSRERPCRVVNVATNRTYSISRRLLLVSYQLVTETSTNGEVDE